jgi:hypothetical protein
MAAWMLLRKAFPHFACCSLAETVIRAAYYSNEMFKEECILSFYVFAISLSHRR